MSVLMKVSMSVSDSSIKRNCSDCVVMVRKNFRIPPYSSGIRIYRPKESDLNTRTFHSSSSLINFERKD